MTCFLAWVSDSPIFICWLLTGIAFIYGLLHVFYNVYARILSQVLDHFSNYLADGFAGGADNIAYLTQDESDTSFKVRITPLNQEYQLTAKILYASTIIYAPLAMTVKVTLLLVLARIYSPFRGAIAVYVLLALNVLYYFIILFIKAFICDPVSAYWTEMTRPKGSGTCLDRSAVIIADSLISVISDIAIFVLPVVFTWPLQMRKTLKIKVVSLLGLGGIAVGFSLYRLVLLIVDGNSPDQSILFMRVLLSGYVCQFNKLTASVIRY